MVADAFLARGCCLISPGRESQSTVVLRKKHQTSYGLEGKHRQPCAGDVSCACGWELVGCFPVVPFCSQECIPVHLLLCPMCVLPSATPLGLTIDAVASGITSSRQPTPAEKGLLSLVFTFQVGEQTVTWPPSPPSPCPSEASVASQAGAGTSCSLARDLGHRVGLPCAWGPVRKKGKAWDLMGGQSGTGVASPSTGSFHPKSHTFSPCAPGQRVELF